MGLIILNQKFDKVSLDTKYIKSNNFFASRNFCVIFQSEFPFSLIAQIITLNCNSMPLGAAWAYYIKVLILPSMA